MEKCSKTWKLKFTVFFILSILNKGHSLVIFAYKHVYWKHNLSSCAFINTRIKYKFIKKNLFERFQHTSDKLDLTMVTMRYCVLDTTRGLVSLCGRHCPYCHQCSSLYLKCWESHQFPKATATSGAVLSPGSIVCHVAFLANCIKVCIRFETYLPCYWVQGLIGEASGNSQKLWNVITWLSFTAHLWPSQGGLGCVQQQ